MNDVHTCPKTQTYPNHRNANKKVIAHILNPKLQDNRRVLKGKDIQHDILLEYKTSISYQQAWRGKDYGLQQIRGSPYESFEMLPYYCYNLERKNQGTVTHIKTDNKGVFEMLFIALGASGETGPCWSWWMSVLKECIGDHSNLLFISDRHPAIALAVHNEFPLSYHAVCCRHLMMNLSLKKKTTKGLFWKICKTYTPDEFTTNMNIIVINRKLPVLKLAETYRAMLQEWYFKRQKLTANMKYEITDWVADKVHKRKLKSATWIVHRVNQYLYQVLNGRYNRQVNLETGVCECRKWQLSRIPCGHIIAVTRFLHLTDCVQYVSDWFKKEILRKYLF
ncbi:transposase, MuDR, MULE transposase domain protein [Tanacetum coccineum]